VAATYYTTDGSTSTTSSIATREPSTSPRPGRSSSSRSMSPETPRP
jgi:hypothetical protein